MRSPCVFNHTCKELTGAICFFRTDLNSCESASRNLAVSFPEATFNIISGTGRESYFIFPSDILKHSNANTVAGMFGRGKHGKERSREQDFSCKLFEKVG